MNSLSQRRNNKKENEISDMNKKIKKGIIIPWEQKKQVIDKEEIQLQEDMDQLSNWVMTIFFCFLISYFTLFSIK